MLNSIFLIVNFSFLPNYHRYYDYMFKLFGGVTCNWCISLHMSCQHFGERPSREDIDEKIEERSVRWLSAVADMTCWILP